jgi:hypothetical protein
MAKSLQDITNAWGNWMNKKHNGGGIKFTASTKYSDQEFFLKNYYERQVKAQMLDIQYAADDTPQLEDKLTADTGRLHNDTDVTQTSTFTKSFSTTQSFTWSVTEQLSIGTEVSATVGIPDVASAGAKVTTDLTLSSTQGATQSETQEWKVEMPIQIPPHSIITPTLVIKTKKYDVRWVGKCKLTGYVAIWFNNKVKLPGSAKEHWLYFIPIQRVFSDCVSHNIIDTAGYENIGRAVLARSAGVFRGSQGVDYSVRITQAPLAPKSTHLAAAGRVATASLMAPQLDQLAATPVDLVADYTVPIDSDGTSALIGVDPVNS